MKKGILLLSYGSPETLDDVAPYYTDIRGGRKPSDQALEELTERYRKIGGKSPLLEITQAQAAALRNLLGNQYAVYVGMKHWKPYIRQAVDQMATDNIKQAVALVLAPHYSQLSVGQYVESVEKVLETNSYSIQFQYVKSWHTHPLFIQLLKGKITAALNKFDPQEKEQCVVLFTAHSLPERILEWNDPYPAQLMETSAVVARDLALKRWQFAYQSAGRTSESWLGPDLLRSVEDLAKDRIPAILVCPIGFIADHLEVLYDIDIQAKSKARTLHVHLERTESLNSSPLLVQAFAEIVRNQFDE